MVQKFEVGKSYYAPASSTKIEVLWTDGKDSLVKYEKSRPVLISAAACLHYEEYREPVVVRGIRYVMSDDSSVWTQKEFSSCEKSYLAGRIEFTVTDGKLTDVKIL